MKWEKGSIHKNIEVISEPYHKEINGKKQIYAMCKCLLCTKEYEMYLPNLSKRKACRKCSLSKCLDWLPRYARKGSLPDENGNKKCSKCLESKNVSNFVKAKNTMDGLSSSCKKCQRNYACIKNYGITLEDYDNLLKSQGGKCACCRKNQEEHEKTFHIDHCHKTGKVRGIVCFHCNSALGMIKDSIETTENIISYLKKASNET